jgi:hypothetical protein
MYYRHAQALAAIKPFAHWLSQFYAESQNYPDQRKKFTDMVSTLLDAITGLFEEQVNRNTDILTFNPLNLCNRFAQL